MNNISKNLLFSCLAIFAFTPWANTFAKEVSYNQEEVKVAFLYRSLQYVKWESVLKDPDSSLVICTNATAHFAELMRSLEGRNISNHKLKIIFNSKLSKMDECNVVYLRSKSISQFREFIKATQGKPILTINDNPAYVKEGGILNFVLKQNHITIEVNLGQAEKNNITFSAKFLRITKLIGNTK